MIGFLPVLGRTLPPLFRTVRRVVRILLTRTPCRFLHRVWQNSAKGWTSAEFCESPKLEGFTEFCGRLNFCSTDFCETKADVSTDFCENVYFLFGRFLRNKIIWTSTEFCESPLLADFCGKLRGWLWLSFGIYPPFLSADFF